MALSPEERAEFIELIPELGDDVDPRRVYSFARRHREQLLDELVKVPGVSKIRAACIRLISKLESDGARKEALLSEAAGAVMQPPTDHPMDRLSRHPAWVGLCVLELAQQQNEWDVDPLERALELSSRSFAAAGVERFDRGEVLWAMAEEASDVGWDQTAQALFAALEAAQFADSGVEADALVVLGIRRIQDGRDPSDVLERAHVLDGASDQARTHSAWMLAHWHQGQDALKLACHWFSRAAESVDRDADPDVAARIDAALSSFQSPTA